MNESLGSVLTLCRGQQLKVPSGHWVSLLLGLTAPNSIDLTPRRSGEYTQIFIRAGVSAIHDACYAFFGELALGYDKLRAWHEKKEQSFHDALQICGADFAFSIVPHRSSLLLIEPAS